MATEDQIAKAMSSLGKVLGCQQCGTRLRFGDLECPHFGADVEDCIRALAITLIDDLKVRIDD